jgi:hypothetical protein
MANFLWIISLVLLFIMAVLNLKIGLYDVAIGYIVAAFSLFVPIQLIKYKKSKKDVETVPVKTNLIKELVRVEAKKPPPRVKESQFPKCIPIRREEDYHTHNIGTYGNRQQFMGFVVANLEQYSADDWQRYKKWYAVLYTFNKKGRLISHKVECFGCTADGERDVVNRAEKELNVWLDELSDKIFENIKVQRFSINYDNVKFGLYTAEEVGNYNPKVDDEELGSYIHLLPNDLVFYPPWTGIYDT